MAEKISVFRSLESEAQFNRAYNAALQLWPVPFEEVYVPTQFGDTHVIVSGPKDAAPLALFHPAGCGAVIWYRNVKLLSQYFITYAVDTMGEVNKSILTHPIRNRHDLTTWMANLLDGLGIARVDLVGNSFAGFLVVNTAILLPDRVKKIVLISPAAPFVPMWAWTWHFFPAYLTG